MLKHVTQIPLQPDGRGVRSVQFKALGTACAIQFRCAVQRTALQFVADALGWLQAFEAKFSRFRPDSLVSQINVAAGESWVKIDSEMEQMLNMGDSMYRLTQGIMDPAMLPLIRVWDWKKVHERLPSDEEVKQALSLSKWEDVKRESGRIFLPRKGMGLDFGGFGKEYAVDQIVAIARKYEIEDLLVDLGRDIYATGGNGIHPFWHVGIQDGVQTERCIGGLAVSGYAVCASGDYARRFEHNGIRYGHILDRRTGWPVSHGLRAITVLGPNCLVAGIYSTCAFILGWREGLQFVENAPGVEACLQNEQGVIVSRHFMKHQVKAA
ncbi:thiamine biosynthesis lipoprotein [Prosthecobacter debontii]|uniref:FAD:protein FMN transferase n=1 Tax=Prosthecobacter debontii TaxID=48467 RepID=A0A1T4Y5Z7_9BACT|nr:FAD:protein FMN transferase [Prosthecobacter debontii]SKA97166.1 thiamine biosynthesis lipoprotein [Prosthecobacter debontii]